MEKETAPKPVRPPNPTDVMCPQCRKALPTNIGSIPIGQLFAKKTFSIVHCVSQSPEDLPKGCGHHFGIQIGAQLSCRYLKIEGIE